MSEKDNKLFDIAETVYLNRDNSSFEKKEGFLYINYDNKTTRVTLQKLFPFHMSDKFVSVLDIDNEEIGIINSVHDDYDEDNIKVIVDELNMKYYSPKILGFLKMKDNYGYLNITAKTNEGEIVIGVKDMYRSMIKLDDGKIFIVDIYGNRYEIENLYGLDRKSQRMIELYM